MAAHRYWRIRSPTANPFGLSEVQMRTAVGGADVTSGGAAIASGNYAGYPPANCFDDDNATLWTTYLVAVPVGGHWVGYDFGAGGDRDIVEFVLRSRSDGFAGEAPRDPIFEWSDNGSTWTRSGDAAGVSWSVAETKVFRTAAPIYARSQQQSARVVSAVIPGARVEQLVARVVSTVADAPPAAARPVVFVIT